MQIFLHHRIFQDVAIQQISTSQLLSQAEASVYEMLEIDVKWAAWIADVKLHLSSCWFSNLFLGEHLMRASSLLHPGTSLYEVT